jgi:hypothetical protein
MTAHEGRVALAALLAPWLVALVVVLLSWWLA